MRVDGRITVITESKLRSANDESYSNEKQLINAQEDG